MVNGAGKCRITEDRVVTLRRARKPISGYPLRLPIPPVWDASRFSANSFLWAGLATQATINMEAIMKQTGHKERGNAFGAVA